jgi:phage gpG-like protein
MLTADVTELKKLRADLLKVGERAKDKNALLKAAGDFMTLTEVPRVFRESGPGWQASRRGGKPLSDTHALASSVTYSIEGETLTVGSKLPQAGLMNDGGTVTAKGKMLTIPDEKLSRAEKANFNLRNWKDTFLKPSASGYTVYQKTGGRGGKSLRVIARLVNSVTIPKRKFLDFTERALDGISRRWQKLVFEGK